MTYMLLRTDTYTYITMQKYTQTLRQLKLCATCVVMTPSDVYI